MCRIPYQHGTIREKPIHSFTRFHFENNDLKEYHIFSNRMWNLNCISGFTNAAADNLSSLKPLTLSIRRKLDFQMSEGWNKQAIVQPTWKITYKNWIFEKLHLTF